VTGGPPDPWQTGDEAAEPAGDVLEGGLRPPWWQHRWRALPRAARLVAAALVVSLAAGAAALELHDRAAEQALARQVDLTAHLGVSSLSTTPPGGQVSFFVVVRNQGPLPVRITSVDGTTGGLRLGPRDDVQRQVSPGGETAVPVSVRLTCPRFDGGAGLTTRIAVRRQDGDRVARRLVPGAAGLLTDVATTLCRSRPDLREQELSGPVLDTLTGDAPGG
jgi:hypothetical protein